MKKRKILSVILILGISVNLISCKNKTEQNIDMINKDEAKATDVSSDFEIEIKSDKKIQLNITNTKKDKLKAKVNYEEGIISFKYSENDLDENEIYCINLENLNDIKFVDNKIKNAKILYFSKQKNIDKEIEYELKNNNIKDEYIRGIEVLNMNTIQITLANKFVEKKHKIKGLKDVKVDGKKETLKEGKTLNLTKGKHKIEFEFEFKDKKFKVNKEIVVKELIDTITDDELVAIADKQMNMMDLETLVISTGNLFETNNDEGKIINGDFYVLINEQGVDSIDKLKNIALKNFSKKYNNDQLFKFYKEVEGNVYVRKIPFGFESDEKEYKGLKVTERNGNEVIFNAYHLRANRYVTFSLVYENGTWKYGFWKYEK